MNKKILLFGYCFLLASAPGTAGEDAGPAIYPQTGIEKKSFKTFVLANNSERQHKTEEASNNTSPLSLSPLEEHKKTTKSILDALRSRHYQDMILNDTSSEKLLDEYIANLDPGKSFFCQTHVFITFRKVL